MNAKEQDVENEKQATDLQHEQAIADYEAIGGEHV